MPKVTDDKPDKPAMYQVAESFVVDVDGVPTAYRQGEDVLPEDPVVRTHLSLLKPWVPAHPLRRARMSAPEVRA